MNRKPSQKFLKGFVLGSFILAAYLWAENSLFKKNLEIDRQSPKERLASHLTNSTFSGKSSLKEIPTMNLEESTKTIPSTTEAVHPLALEINKETYRQEVQANPHGSPLSLMNFAKNMAQKVQSLKPEQKDQFINELKDCALNKDLPQAIRVSCFVNLKRYTKVTDLKNQDPAVLKMAKILESEN